MKQLQTLKNDLSKTRIVQTKNPEIEAEEISVSIESFAFTSNNVTYGVAGNTIGYWQFFKTTEDANNCLLYTSPSPRDKRQSRMPSSA